MREPDPTVAVLGQVIDEVRLVFHRLKAAAERVHGEGERSAARRGVLLDLHRCGPRTVPQMASSRPVSRQHIQVVVNGLIDDGLVELAPNPAHTRSHLVRLTESGAERVRAIIDRETAIFRRLDLKCSRVQLVETARVLAQLREAFAAPAIEDAIRRAVSRAP